MRVLLYARPGSDRILAGDAVQARATAAALRELGIQADLAEGDSLPDPASYDLVHLFNLMPVETTHAAFRTARAAGKPVVLATIFWDPAEFLEIWDRGGAFAGWWTGTDRLRREVLAGARVILPNSLAELDCLRRAFGPVLPPHVIVPNGVDVSLFRPGLRAALPRVDILCVGRISARKNQLGLLEALRGTGLSVRFVGPVNDFNYYQSCRAAAWPGVEFREEMRGPRLAAVYAAAKVHVLASWYETPGLASLEAAACGCRVVSTDRGARANTWAGRPGTARRRTPRRSGRRSWPPWRRRSRRDWRRRCGAGSSGRRRPRRRRRGMRGRWRRAGIECREVSVCNGRTVAGIGEKISQ